MYKDDTQKKVMEVLQLFFTQDQGNRLTIFNTSGLVSRIEKVFRENLLIQNKPKKKGKR